MKGKRLLLLGLAISGCLPLTRANLHPGFSGSILTICDTSVLIEKMAAQSPDGSDKVISDIVIPGTKTGFDDLFLNSADEKNGSKLNPRAVSFVQDYMEKNIRDLQNMKSWGRPYFNMIDGILVQYGLPRELKYLAVIESRLKPNSVSWAGAVGPWQLMPGTARLLGS